MTATAANFASLLAFDGKGAAASTRAFANVPVFAAAEATARADLIAAIRTVLKPDLAILLRAKSATPDDAEKLAHAHLAAVRTAFAIGRVSARLPSAAIPKDRRADAMSYAFDLVTAYAAPVQPGKKANNLRKGQIGRRTDVQHRIVRNAEEAWYQVANELGIGKGKTNAERNANAANKPASAKDSIPGKGASMSKANAKGKDAPAPTHSELVKDTRPKSAQAFNAHVDSMASSLLAYANKYAGVAPLEMARMIHTFKQGVAAIAAAYAEEADKQDAEKAEREPA